MITTMLVLFLMWMNPQATDGGLRAKSKAPSWSLKDSNDVAYQSSQLTGKTILIIGGDKKSQDSNAAWASRVKASCGGDLTGMGIADVSAAPKLLKGLYRNQIRGDASKMGVPILLDWDGSVARSFHFKPDVSNVFLIQPDSSIAYVAVGAPTDDGIKQLCAAASKQSQ